jgi:hypothetical protein
MQKAFVLILVAIGLCLTRCSQQQPREKLYPIDSLLNEQVNLFQKHKVTLTKEASLKESEDEKNYLPKNRAAWVKELDILFQLATINKPGNKSNYIIDNELYDPGSNLTVKALTTKKDLPVRSLRVFYDRDPLQPRKIEAVFQEGNVLYSTARNLLLEFQQIDNKNMLTSYSIDGVQKMVLSDSVRFVVRARINVEKN